MKRMLSLFYCLALFASAALAEKRFDREVIKVENQAQYAIIKIDDVKYPVLERGPLAISTLVYKGTLRYYVEITITNHRTSEMNIAPDFVAFSKPGYSAYRTDTVAAAVDVARDAEIPFMPFPPPVIPPTANTTINATASTYGNQTEINGTATTTYDYSGQAGANLGNTIGNAIAARRYRAHVMNEAKFAHFLNEHAQPPVPITLKPGETRTIVATFEQAKKKSAPFEIVVTVQSEQFHFAYKG